MKKVGLLVVLLSLLILHVDAQRVKEFGLSFRNLDNFGFVYKTGTEKGLVRISLLSLNAYKEGQDIDSESIGVGLSGGYEMRNPLSDDLSFVYGPGIELAASYRDVRQESSSYKLKTLRSDLYCSLGLRYLINNKFSVSAELFPSIYYAVSADENKTLNRKFSSDRIGLSINNSALITLAYRLGK